MTLPEENNTAQIQSGHDTNNAGRDINRAGRDIIHIHMHPLPPLPPSPTPQPIGPIAPKGPIAPNPFGRTGRIEDPAEFFDREHLLHRMFEELGKHQSLALIGKRQIGKSSLLAMVKARGPQQLNLPPQSFLMLDMQLIHNEGEFFEAICYMLGIPTCRGYQLERRIAGHRFILCLDEIEKMSRNGFSGNERAELRELADGPSRPFKLVIASSIPLNQLFPDTHSDTSPLYNICHPLHVFPFHPDVARDFLITRLALTNVRFQEDEINRLITSTGGHPAKLHMDLFPCSCVRCTRTKRMGYGERPTLLTTRFSGGLHRKLSTPSFISTHTLLPSSRTS